MYCIKCGMKINDDAKTCPSCGEVVWLEDNELKENDRLFKSTKKEYKWTVKKVILGILGGLAPIGLLFVVGLIIDKVNNPIEDKSKLTGVYGGGATGLVEYYDGTACGSGVYYKYLVEFHNDGTAIWWQNDTFYTGDYNYNSENENYTLTVQGSGFVPTTTFIINKTSYTEIKNRPCTLDNSFYMDELKVNGGLTESIYGQMLIDSLYGTDVLYEKNGKTFVYKDGGEKPFKGCAFNVNGGVFNNSLFEELTNYKDITDVVNDLHNDTIIYNPFVAEK